MLMTESDSLEATVRNREITSLIIISLRSSIQFGCLIFFFFLHKDLSQGSRDTGVRGLPLKSLQCMVCLTNFDSK